MTCSGAGGIHHRWWLPVVLVFCSVSAFLLWCSIVLVLWIIEWSLFFLKLVATHLLGDFKVLSSSFLDRAVASVSPIVYTPKEYLPRKLLSEAGTLAFLLIECRPQKEDQGIAVSRTKRLKLIGSLIRAAAPNCVGLFADESYHHLLSTFHSLMFLHDLNDLEPCYKISSCDYLVIDSNIENKEHQI